MTKLLTCIGLIFYRAMLCVDGEFIEPPSSLVLRSFIGTQTRLPCRFAAQEDESVVQVTWYRQKPGGEREQIIIGHFTEGPEASPDFLNRVQFESHKPTLDSTLLILDTKKVDQATYTCHITTFPSGNFERQIDVTVWILPISTLDAVILQEGQSSRMAASCRSVGYPPPRLSWDTDITGQSQNRTGDNGLVTSEFSLNPVRGMNGHRLDCLVWHPALDKPRRLQNNLIVQYPPDAEIHAFGSWRFGKTGAELRCAVKGNPQPHNITWSRKGDHLPDSVLVQGDKLIFSRPLNMTDKGVYVCQTANTVGSIKSEYKVEIEENTEEIIEWIKAHSETMLIVLGASAAGSLVVIMVIILIYVNCHLKHKNRNLKRALSVQTEQMVSLSRQASMRRLGSITSDPRIPDYSIIGDQRSRQGDYDYLGRPAIYTAFEPERASRKLRERDEEIKERQRRVASYVKSSDASLDSGLHRDHSSPPSMSTGPAADTGADSWNRGSRREIHRQEPDERDTEMQTDRIPEGEEETSAINSYQISEAMNNFRYSNGGLTPKASANGIILHPRGRQSEVI
ncbi:nectin-4 isoform X2 [Misgurnus anguillicaudatus]|uniref:nectin-4 isoform X2 n=1 Tax=Misgurnus anguillicaudatus TaxID=75329 RepID=UPI003CCF9821